VPKRFSLTFCIIAFNVVLVSHIRHSYEMDEDEKKPNEINPIRSVGCAVGYFIVGLVIYLFFAWVF